MLVPCANLTLNAVGLRILNPLLLEQITNIDSLDGRLLGDHLNDGINFLLLLLVPGFLSFLEPPLDGLNIMLVFHVLLLIKSVFSGGNGVVEPLLKFDILLHLLQSLV